MATETPPTARVSLNYQQTNDTIPMDPLEARVSFATGNLFSSLSYLGESLTARCSFFNVYAQLIELDNPHLLTTLRMIHGTIEITLPSFIQFLPINTTVAINKDSNIFLSLNILISGGQHVNE